MIKADEHDNFEQYRLITMLSGTAVIGVMLIFFAVYNASRDLELIQGVNALHEFAQSSLPRSTTSESPVVDLKHLPPDDYRIHILENGELQRSPDSRAHQVLSLDTAQLEESRININGGHIELQGKTYIWTALPAPGLNTSVVVLQRFKETSNSILAEVYSRRLLIPGIFYVWLMVWVALIIRFLLKKLDAQNRKLAHLALHDSLTGLANRNLLEDRLQMMIEDCRRHQRTFALINLDMNHFKEVNDTYGHEQGDELLRLFSDRARKLVRSADTFARIGGDEFIMLLHDMDTKSCISMCERFRALTSKPYALPRAEVSIDISIGVAIFPEHGEELATLMRHADQAMYVSKASGGGINIYNQSLSSREGKDTPDNCYA